MRRLLRFLLFAAVLALWEVGVRAQTPTAWPTFQPTTHKPTPHPTMATLAPTSEPTSSHKPTLGPSGQPSSQPTGQPSSGPTSKPTRAPHINANTQAPTQRPVAFSAHPTFAPSAAPPASPTPAVPPTPAAAPSPTSDPPTSEPTGQPTSQPSTSVPTFGANTTRKPTGQPTGQPSSRPTGQPSALPTGQPTGQPSRFPTGQPTSEPTVSHKPTPFSSEPTGQPTSQPTAVTQISSFPTNRPTSQPSSQPSGIPTGQPSRIPTGQPTSQPTNPTGQPTSSPTDDGVAEPTGQPTSQPTNPTGQPTTTPTEAEWEGTRDPTGQPTSEPSGLPTGQPTSSPSEKLGVGVNFVDGTSKPTSQPTGEPSGQPTSRPTAWRERDTISSSPTALISRETLSGTVKFDPPNLEVCEDAEIKIAFTNTLRVNTFGAFKIMTPGLTVGDCMTPVAHTKNTTGTPLRSTAWPFHLTFFEGTYADSFIGSYIMAENYLEETGTWDGFEITIDRENGLKKTCPANSTWSVYRYIRTPLWPDGQAYPTMQPTPLPTAREWEFPTQAPWIWGSAQTPTSMPTGIIQANEREYRSGYVGDLTMQDVFKANKGFFYEARLSFHPAQMLTDTTVNLTISMGFVVKTGDVIKLTLPGFTNKEVGTPINPGRIFAISTTFGGGNDDNLSRVRTGQHLGLGTDVEANAWTGNWYEGTEANGFTDAYLQLTAQRSFPAGVPIQIAVDRFPNGLMSRTGRPPNYEGFILSVVGETHFVENVAPTKVDGRGSTFTSTRFSVQAIGDGCREQNYCSENGACNYETNVCECFEGYGSNYDLIYSNQDDFKPDCTSRSCPKAAAWADMPHGAQNISHAEELRRPIAWHREMECANAGQCDRAVGKCKCFPGFEGPACERRGCPRPFGDNSQPICGGRGVCKKMARLAHDLQALPLSKSSNTRYKTHNQNDSALAWDANMLFACVCDSRWAVGLTNRTTQLAEYYGPACEYRRCPSGDDPSTKTTDETDCTGKSQTGGADTGDPGNKCHVDCSNQGTCNHNTGVCTCFSGFFGDNCGIHSTDLSEQTHTLPIHEL